MIDTLASHEPPPLEPREFEALRAIIRDATGIHLRETKVALVRSRLARRLAALGLGSYREYIDFVRSGKSADEVRELINCMTTNKTSFFREPHHFDFLRSTVVPSVARRPERSRRIRIWSAGCSTGQEPWSIAIALHAALGGRAGEPIQGWDVRILASDIDTDVLRVASDATYSADEIDSVPAPLRRGAFERAPDGRLRIVPALRSLVTFRQLNLVQPPWPIRTRFDAIFCRNVAIYFDRQTQRRLYSELARLLEPTGYLMSGHSENLQGLCPSLVAIGNTIHVPAKSREESTREQTPREVSIEVGGVHASRDGAVIHTTLGSCVAACLYDPVSRIGGMNHFMLPQSTSVSRVPASFGVHAMESLIDAIARLGGDRRRLIAKLFGGGALVSQMPNCRIGEDNAAFAVQYLRDQGIEVRATKLGGTSPLRVSFDCSTGIARVCALEDARNVSASERRLVAS